MGARLDQSPRTKAPQSGALTTARALIASVTISSVDIALFRAVVFSRHTITPRRRQSRRNSETWLQEKCHE
jgi:hypothetical protein